MGLDLVEMVMELEKEFELDMPDDDLRAMRTVGISTCTSKGDLRTQAASLRLAASMARYGATTSISSNERPVCPGSPATGG